MSTTVMVREDWLAAYPVLPDAQKLEPPYTSEILKPPEGAWWTGEMWKQRFPVYRREEVIHGPREQVLDRHGEPIEIRNPRTNEFVRFQTKRKRVVVVREFIIEPLDKPNARFKTRIGVLNYHFREDPAQLARLERDRLIRETQSQLAEKLVEAGLTVDDLINRIASRPDDGIDDDEVEPWPRHKGRGWWESEDGRTVRARTQDEAIEKLGG